MPPTQVGTQELNRMYHKALQTTGQWWLRERDSVIEAWLLRGYVKKTLLPFERLFILKFLFLGR